jgi:hypothetical protein
MHALGIKPYKMGFKKREPFDKSKGSLFSTALVFKPNFSS